MILRRSMNRPSEQPVMMKTAVTNRVSLRHQLHLLWLSILLLALHPTAFLTPVIGSIGCPPISTFGPGESVNIALLVWLVDQPAGLFQGNLADTQATTVPGYGTTLIQPFQLAMDFYVQEMKKRGGHLPLPNGEEVHLNFVYINLAGAKGQPNYADYSDVVKNSNLAKFIISSTYPSAPTSDVYQLYQQIVSLNATVLHDAFGITQPFTYIVTPPLFLDVPTTFLMNLIDDAQSHIVVHPFATARELFVCDGVKDASKSLTPDCLSPIYGRNRRGGARRWQSLFGTLFDSTANQYAAIDNFHVLGVKTVVIINEGVTPFSYQSAAAAAQIAEQLNIRVLNQYTLVVADNCDSSINNQTAANCPPVSLGGIYSAQSQVFERGMTTDDAALELQQYNADALIIIAAPNSPAGWTLGRLFNSMRTVNYIPKAISFGGGVDKWILNFLDHPTDTLYTWSTKPWDPKLKGPSYKNILSDTQFELFPANATHDGPQIFTDAFEARFGAQSNTGANGTGAHPMWDPNWTESCLPAIGVGTMMVVQKLIETSMTRDVPAILIAAKSVSSPGIYQQVQFDQYGRTSRVNEVLVQKTEAGSVLLAPYNIGSPTIFPLPTWEERVFKPVFYEETNEKIMVVINSMCILFCVVLIIIVCWNRYAPVIRAATPSFCLLIIFGGILMLISNYFNTLVVNDAHCAASVWLLTIGFTVVYSAMFIKTFRLFKIFNGMRLQVLKMRDYELLLAVCVFISIDVIINSIWMGVAGIHAIQITVDPVRPQSNYYQCDFHHAQGAIYSHLIVKGCLLICGVVLTYATRGLPSAFNESTLIGFSIYNVSFVICFILPIVAVGLGGRETVYLIRAYAIMFVVLTTFGLLYIPKVFHLAHTNLVVRTSRRVSFKFRDNIPQLHQLQMDGTGDGGETRIASYSPMPGNVVEDIKRKSHSPKPLVIIHHHDEVEDRIGANYSIAPVDHLPNQLHHSIECDGSGDGSGSNGSCDGQDSPQSGEASV